MNHWQEMSESVENGADAKRKLPYRRPTIEDLGTVYDITNEGETVGQFDFGSGASQFQMT